jgi:hypothetical protein
MAATYLDHMASPFAGWRRGFLHECRRLMACLRHLAGASILTRLLAASLLAEPLPDAPPVTETADPAEVATPPRLLAARTVAPIAGPPVSPATAINAGAAA